MIDANHAAVELFGRPRVELVGSAAEDAEWLVTDAIDGPLSIHPAIAAIKTKLPVRSALARARRQDGVDLWLQVDAVPDLGYAALHTLDEGISKKVTHYLA